MMLLLAVATATSQAGSQPATQSAVEHWWDVSRWDTTTWLSVGLAALVAIMVVVWGAVRFWLVVTRPPNIKDVHTPTLDRRNQEALAHMGEGVEEEEPDEAPADLLAAVPEEEKPADEPKEDGESTAKPA